MTYATSLSRFDPLAGQPCEESEHYYTRIHVPFARKVLGSMPAIARYSTYRVIDQYDAAGGWQQRPTAWRFVEIVRDTDPPPALPEGWPPSTQTDSWREVLGRDHANFLHNMRRYDLASRTLFDRGLRQTSVQQYWFEYERDPAADAVEATSRFGRLADAFVAAVHGAPGLQVVILQDVTTEGVHVPITQDRQLPTGDNHPDTTMVGYLQVHFDHAAWGEPVFRTESVRTLLQDSWFAGVSGYRLHEEVGFDRRLG